MRKRYTVTGASWPDTRQDQVLSYCSACTHSVTHRHWTLYTQIIHRPCRDRSSQTYMTSWALFVSETIWSAYYRLPTRREASPCLLTWPCREPPSTPVLQIGQAGKDLETALDHWTSGKKKLPKNVFNTLSISWLEQTYYNNKDSWSYGKSFYCHKATKNAKCCQLFHLHFVIFSRPFKCNYWHCWHKDQMAFGFPQQHRTRQFDFIHSLSL